MFCQPTDCYSFKWKIVDVVNLSHSNRPTILQNGQAVDSHLTHSSTAAAVIVSQIKGLLIYVWP